MASRIKMARANAKRGRYLRSARAGPDGGHPRRRRTCEPSREARAAMEEVPKFDPPAVNAAYPEKAALATVPPLLLDAAAAPARRAGYRFMGRDLILQGHQSQPDRRLHQQSRSDGCEDQVAMRSLDLRFVQRPSRHRRMRDRAGRGAVGGPPPAQAARLAHGTPAAVDLKLPNKKGTVKFAVDRRQRHRRAASSTRSATQMAKCADRVPVRLRDHARRQHVRQPEPARLRHEVRGAVQGAARRATSSSTRRSATTTTRRTASTSRGT